MNKKVIVGVKGGIAYPVSVPAGVELEIRDYDGPKHLATCIDGFDKDGLAYASTTAEGQTI